MALEAASSVAAPSSAASSEVSSASSSTPSSSQSTSDIAASVIADIESGKSGSGSDESSGEVTPPATTPAAKTVDPDDFDAVENDNPIPHKRVKAMVSKKEAAAEKRVIATIAKELGISKAEAELKLEDITGELTTRKTKFSEYEGKATQAQQVEDIMDKEPERFVNMMLQANPGYREVMQKVLGGAAAAAAQPQTPAADNDPEPEMDRDLGNGERTYSAEGFKKLREWERRQGKRDAEALINEKLSPYEKERKEKADRERVEAIHTQAREAIATKLEKARKWPEFTKHEEEIAKAINTGLNLEDAYMQVVMPKLAADRNAMREAILAEQAAQPRSTSVGVGAAPVKETSKAKTTRDYAAEEMARAGGA